MSRQSALKPGVDVRTVATRWGGGGHTNAAGCTIAAPLDTVKRHILPAPEAAIDAATPQLTVNN